MFKKTNNRGMTLIELMVVVAIIAVLAGIAAYFITGSKNSNAQKDLYNELGQLFQEQRSRASSMNVATYILFSKGSIEPRIGNSNICARKADPDPRFPIKYYEGSANVAIDIADGTNTRTTQSEHSNKYVFNGKTLVSVDVFSLDAQEKATSAGNNPVLCFQPNGQVVFMHNDDEGKSGFQKWAGLVARIDSPNSPGYYYVQVTGMGFIRMYSEAK